MNDSTNGEVRLWTIQSESRWEKAERVGVMRGEIKRVDPHMRDPYCWLIKQMANRLDNYEGGFPIWAWARKKPDKRFVRHLSNDDPSVRIEFLAPESEVLISHFDAWHCVLNRSYCGLTEQDQALFEERQDALDGYARKGLHPEIEQSWVRIFDLEALRKCDWGSDPLLQATVEQVRLEQVVRVDYF